jgi:hypothetical protein
LDWIGWKLQIYNSVTAFYPSWTLQPAADLFATSRNKTIQSSTGYSIVVLVLSTTTELMRTLVIEDPIYLVVNVNVGNNMKGVCHLEKIICSELLELLCKLFSMTFYWR